MRILRRVTPTLARGRLIKAASVALLAVAASMLWAPRALAESKTLMLNHDDQSWFWSSNRDFRQCTGTDQTGGLCPTADLSAGSPVEPGHLAVAMQAGSSDMRSYLQFAVPLDADISSVVLKLGVSQTDANDTDHTSHHAGAGAKAPATTNASQAVIGACAVKIPWAGGTEAAPPYSTDAYDPTTLLPQNQQPIEPFVKNGIDCDHFKVEGKAASDGKSWTWDLTGLARQWSAGTYENNGIALLPELTNNNSNTATWRMEFHGAPYTVQNNEQSQVYVSEKEAGLLQLVYVPPVEPPPPPPPSSQPAVSDGGGTTATPTIEPTPAPPPFTSATPTPQPSVEQTRPVAQPAAGTAWYSWLLLPFGIAAFSGLSRAVGREAGEAGANRVASVIRRRRDERLP